MAFFVSLSAAAVRGVAVFSAFEGSTATSVTDGFFATGPAVLRNGFALGIKAVDLSRRSYSELFGGGLRTARPFEFVDDGGPPVAQAVNNRFPAARHRIQEDAHVADTGQ